MEILGEALGEDHYRVDAARVKLITLYETWGRQAEAEAERALLAGS